MRHPGIEAKRLVGLFVVVFIAAVLGGCAGEKLERFEFTRLEMGVRARIVTYAPTREAAEVGAQAAFARIAELDACMSDYRPDSELMRLCAAPAGKPVVVSRDLFEVLATAQRVSEASGGAFDVTVGSTVALWRKARKSKELPSAEAIQTAQERVGWRNVVLDSRTRAVTLMKPSMQLDLGGIAKGYGAERGVQALRAQGQARCLVALAGDIFAGDPPPGANGWRVDVVADPQSPWHTLLLKNEGVSTSGDLEQFVEVGGTRYSHIVDPRTGMALTTRLEVTVVARTGAIADSLGKVVSVLGIGGGTKLAVQQGAAVVVQQPAGPVMSDSEAYPLRWADQP